MIRRFARPYAKAVIQLAGSPEKAKLVADELAYFERARSGSPELMGLFANPGVDYATKSRVVAGIGAKVGLSDLAGRFLDVLVKNYRINDLGQILESLHEMINIRLGIATAKVRTAQPLGEVEKTKLIQALAQRVGKQIELEVTTDPSLLGGFVASVGSEVFDASVTGHIEKFRHSLT